MKWLGTGFGLITLQIFHILCTYQLGEELEALLPVQLEFHFPANQNEKKRLVSGREEKGFVIDRAMLLIDVSQNILSP